MDLLSHSSGMASGGGGDVGDIKGTIAAVAPNGWLICDGSAVSRTTYAALFALIGVTYGPGDGATTFNLPDFQGRVLAGLGTNADVNAFTDNDGLAVASRTPRHTHGPGTLGGTTGTEAGSVAATPLLGSAAPNDHVHGFSVTTGVTATNGPAWGVVNWVVKAVA